MSSLITNPGRLPAVIRLIQPAPGSQHSQICIYKAKFVDTFSDMYSHCFLLLSLSLSVQIWPAVRGSPAPKLAILALPVVLCLPLGICLFGRPQGVQLVQGLWSANTDAVL